MIVIDSIDIGDAQLISSGAAEPTVGIDPAAWNGATAYAVGDLVHRTTTHRIYKRLVAGTTGTVPEHDIEGYPGVTTPNWEDHAPINRWACFDQVINTKTRLAAGPLAITIKPGVIVRGLALLELEGDSVLVTMTDGAGGPEVYRHQESLITSLVTDWYGYFFEPFTTSSLLILQDLPPYLNGYITVSLTGSGAVAIGGFVVGPIYTIGRAMYGAGAGIIDYTKKDADLATGVVKLQEGQFRDSNKLQVVLPTGAINSTHALLKRLRARAVVWVGIEDSGDYQPFIVFGFFRNFTLTVPYPSKCYYQLEIEGMT